MEIVGSENEQFSKKLEALHAGLPLMKARLERLHIDSPIRSIYLTEINLNISNIEVAIENIENIARTNPMADRDKVIEYGAQVMEEVRAFLAEHEDKAIVVPDHFRFRLNVDHDTALKIYVEQGSAPDEDIADFLAEISILNRMMGGHGINFEMENVFTSQTAVV